MQIRRLGEGKPPAFMLIPCADRGPNCLSPEGYNYPCTVVTGEDGLLIWLSTAASACCRITMRVVVAHGAGLQPARARLKNAALELFALPCIERWRTVRDSNP